MSVHFRVAWRALGAEKAVADGTQVCPAALDGPAYRSAGGTRVPPGPRGTLLPLVLLAPPVQDEPFCPGLSAVSLLSLRAQSPTPSPAPRVQVEFYVNENTFKERLKLFFIKNQRSSEWGVRGACGSLWAGPVRERRAQGPVGMALISASCHLVSSGR